MRVLKLTNDQTLSGYFNLNIEEKLGKKNLYNELKVRGGARTVTCSVGTRGCWVECEVMSWRGMLPKLELTPQEHVRKHVF